MFSIIILTIYLLLSVIYYIIILDIILSWLVLFWLKIQLKFLKQIINPIYDFVWKTFPTKLWVFDLKPIIIIFIIIIMKSILLTIDPSINYYL